MKICLSCSSGGHFDELMCLWDSFVDHEIFFTLPYTPITKNLSKSYKVFFFHEPPKPIKHLEKLYYLQLLPYYIYLLFVSVAILLKEKPNVIIGNGGEATLGLAYVGKLFKVNIIYIESLARSRELSGTGKLVYPLCNLFLVQWSNLVIKYPKAKYWGKVV